MKVYLENYILDSQLFYLIGTKNGLSFVSSPNANISEASEFLPKDVEFETSSGRFNEQAQAIKEILRGHRVDFPGQFDILKGTEFQKNVWQELQNVKFGEVITYKQLAKRIGKESSYRAVASAVAKNPLLFALPCHRIIRADRQVGQYRGGSALKRHLLNLEKRNFLITRR